MEQPDDLDLGMVQRELERIDLQLERIEDEYGQTNHALLWQLRLIRDIWASDPEPDLDSE